MSSETVAPAVTGERADLIESLDRHRYFLRFAVRGLTDEQATQRTTVSQLTLAALIKHVAATEATWVRFIRGGAAAMRNDPDAWARDWRIEPGETLESLLAAYDAVARDTDELVAELPDLDAGHPLPPAPWFAPGAAWSARRVLLHIIAETSQHAGHADILREALDGQKTMG
jgi:uncharacterized damage-inducible protein DinB